MRTAERSQQSARNINKKEGTKEQPANQKTRESSKKQQKNDNAEKIIKGNNVQNVLSKQKTKENQTLPKKNSNELQGGIRSSNPTAIVTSKSAGRGQGTAAHLVQSKKTSTSTTSATAGLGRATSLKGSRFMKPADFVPRPFQMKVLDGKAKLPKPVLKCFSDDNKEENTATSQENSQAATSTGTSQSGNPVKVESIFSDASMRKEDSTAISAQSSSAVVENRFVYSFTEGTSKHSRIVLPPSRKRKVEEPEESKGISMQQIESNQKIKTEPYEKNEFKKARSSSEQVGVREEVKSSIKQNLVSEEKGGSPKRTVVRSSSGDQQQSSKDKRNEKSKLVKDDYRPKESKRQEREKEKRTDKGAKDGRRESSNSDVKRKDHLPGFYILMFLYNAG